MSDQFKATIRSGSSADTIPSQNVITAHTRSSVIAPVLASNTFNAPVNLNIYSDAGNKGKLQVFLIPVCSTSWGHATKSVHFQL